MGFFDYEHMKQFLVLFFYCAVWMLVVISYGHHIKSFVRWIIRKVHQHNEKKKAAEAEQA